MKTATTIPTRKAAYDLDYLPSTMDNNGWKGRHLDAMSRPRPSEAWIVHMLRGWVETAKNHREIFERGIGQDGYAADPWAEIGKSLHHLLNMEIGRLDCGTLSAIILDTLDAEGYDYDMAEWRKP